MSLKKMFGIDKREEKAARSRRQNSLLTGIRKDETISDITRQELLLSVEGGSPSDRALDIASSIFSKAKEGIEDKFKSRQAIQATFETMFDQPGRRQTIAASSNRNNRLIG